MSSDAEQLLRAFYSRHNPEKLDTIPVILEKYEGREEMLIGNLMDKYSISREQLLQSYPGVDIERLLDNKSIDSGPEKSVQPKNFGVYNVDLLADLKGVGSDLMGSLTAATADIVSSQIVQSTIARPSAVATTATLSTSTLHHNEKSNERRGGASAYSLLDGWRTQEFPQSVAATVSVSSAILQEVKEDADASDFSSGTSPLLDLAGSSIDISNSSLYHVNQTGEVSVGLKATKFAQVAALGHPPSRLREHAVAMISDLEKEVQELVKALTQAQARLVETEDALTQKKEDILHERKEREKEKKDDTLRLANLQAKITVIEANDDDGASSNSNKGSSYSAATVALESEFEKLRDELASSQMLIKNKHQQLLEVVSMNHKLGAQVRFLSARAFDSYVTRERYDLILGKETARVPDFILPEAEALTTQVLALVATSTETRKGGGVRKADSISKSNSRDISPSIALKMSAIAEAYNGNPKAQVTALCKALDVVHASWIGNRVELKHALREAAIAETRTQELQRQVDHLNGLVSLPLELTSLHTRVPIAKKEENSRFTKSLNNNSGTSQHDANLLAQLCAMLEQSRRDHTLSRTACIRAEAKAASLAQEVSLGREQLRRAEEDVAAAQASKLRLVELTRKQTREAEERAFDAAQAMVQRILDEQEELLTKVRSIEDLEASFQALQERQEAQEVAKWRKQAQESQLVAVQSAREVEFLKRQLIEAADILQSSRDVPLHHHHSFE